MKNNLTISAVMPVRDQPDTFIPALKSLIDSRTIPDEIIIVDDGSEIPVSLPDPNQKIKLIRFEESRGPAAARNAGAAEAKSDIILFLDSDVVLDSQTIDRILHEYSMHPDLAALQGIYTENTPSSTCTSRYQNYYYHFVFARMSGAMTAICASFCFAIRRSIFMETDGFDTGIRKPTVEDEAYGYRLAQKGHFIKIHDQIRVTHLATYSVRSFMRRKIRMSFHQVKSIIRGVRPPRNPDCSGTFRSSHHSLRFLAATLTAPLLFPLLFLSLPAAAIAWIAYMGLNANLWLFIFSRERLGRFPCFLALTWIDQICIDIGLAAGVLDFLRGNRY